MGSKVQLELYWLYLWLMKEIGKRSKQKTQSIAQLAGPGDCRIQQTLTCAQQALGG